MQTPPRYTRNPHLNFELDDVQAYVELSAGSWAVLNPTARALWESLAAPRTADELLAVVLQRFAGDEASVAGDINATLADWRERGIVEVHDRP